MRAGGGGARLTRGAELCGLAGGGRGERGGTLDGFLGSRCVLAWNNAAGAGGGRGKCGGTLDGFLGSRCVLAWNSAAGAELCGLAGGGQAGETESHSGLKKCRRGSGSRLAGLGSACLKTRSTPVLATHLLTASAPHHPPTTHHTAGAAQGDGRSGGGPSGGSEPHGHGCGQSGDGSRRWAGCWVSTWCGALPVGLVVCIYIYMIHPESSCCANACCRGRQRR